MTMLLGATFLLKSLQQSNSIPGTIRIIFQPAEEGGAGAKRMTEEGVLKQHPPPSYAFGMHVWPTMQSGEIGLRSGTMFAAADMFTLTIEGVGGHAAWPHLTKDPIVASASIIMNVQSLISRSMNPLESGVVSITRVDAGDGAHNVIPAKAVLKGTIRALDDDSMRMLQEGLVHIASTTAQTYGCKLASSTFARDYYPVVINDDKLYPFAAKVAGLVGEHIEVDPTMGGEDFAFFGKSII
jgi:amidohydrolase